MPAKFGILLFAALLAVGCGGNDFKAAALATFTLRGTTITPPLVEVRSGGVLALANPSLAAVSVTFSSALPAATVPQQSTLQMTLPIVAVTTQITCTVTGGDSAVVRIVP